MSGVDIDFVNKSVYVQQQTQTKHSDMWAYNYAPFEILQDHKSKMYQNELNLKDKV